MAEFGEVGSATVSLRASMDRLSADLRKARGTVDKSATGMGRGFGTSFAAAARSAIVPALGALFAAASFRSIARGAERAIATLDEIGKTADSIGITTDALQELRVAADLSGVGQGELDAALRRFSRAAKEASDGVAEYKDAFDRLGVTVTDNQGKLKSIDELVGDVADGMQGLENGTEKAALAQELFGRSGTKMVNLLREGSSGIDEMREEARRLGIVIDESLIRRSEEANDKLTLLNRVIDAAGTTILADLAPALITVTQLLADFARWVADAHEGLRLFLGAASRIPNIRRLQITQRLAELRVEADEARRNLESVASTGRTLAEDALPFASADSSAGPEQLNQTLDQTAQKLSAIEAETTALNQELAALSETRIDLVPDIPSQDVDIPSIGGGGGGGSVTADLDARIEGYQRLAERIEGMVEAQVIEREEIRVLTETVGMEEEARQDLIEALETERLQRELMKAAQQAASAGDAQAIQDAEMLADALGAVTAARQRDEAQLRKQEEALQAAADREREFADALQQTGDELIRAAFEGGNFIQILADLLLRLIEIQLQAQVTGGGGGGGLLGSLFSSVFSGIGGLLGIGGAAPATSPIPVPRRFAEGGLPPVGQFSLVGERGPELAFFGSTARVFSNEDLKEALSGGGKDMQPRGVQVSMTINTPDAGSFRRSQSQIAAELGRMINSANARQT